MTNLQDFFSNYPEYGEEAMEWRLANKTEFRQLDSDVYRSYQVLLSRLLNFNTPYDGLLVVHAMGTGKTCSAVAVVEASRLKYRGALVLAPNERLLNNFKSELVFKCTMGKYVPAGFRMMSEQTKIRRLNSSTRYYRMETYEKFAKQLDRMSDEQIVELYDNRVWVFDEAHAILNTEMSSFVQTLRRARDLCPGAKLMLLTGTPMVDRVDEILKLANLLFSSALRLDTSSPRLYIQGDGAATQLLRQKLRGRVSWLSARKLVGVKPVYEGERLFSSLLPVVASTMRATQLARYLAVWTAEKNTGLYADSRAADLAVFPDGTTAIGGEERWVFNHKLTAEARQFFEHSPSRLADVSCKYALLVARCRQAMQEKRRVYVYCEAVRGVGLFYLSAILRHSHVPHHLLDPFLTSTQMRARVDSFNLNGSVILGSSATATGLSFVGIQQVEILTPGWNFSSILQAIGRGTRLGSHRAIQAPVYNVALHVALTSGSLDESISLYMFMTSFRKDRTIRQMEKSLAQIAVDCMELSEQNSLQGLAPDSRECFYGPCELRCESERPLADLADSRTFNLFFARSTIEREVQRVIELFRDKTMLRFDQVALSGPSHFLTCSALDKIIAHNLAVRGRYVLREEGNWVYVATLTGPQSWFDSFYIDAPLRIANTSTLVEEEARRFLFEAIMRDNDYEMFWELARPLQAEIFEVVWLVGDATFVSVYFVNYHVKREDGVVLHWITPNVVRWLPVGAQKWVDAPEQVSRALLASLAEKRERLESNSLELLGQYRQYPTHSDTRSEFCIRDLSTRALDVGNARKTGRKCSGMPKASRDAAAAKLGIATRQGEGVPLLCGRMYDEFEKRQLLVEDPFCGLSTKTRSGGV
jgi:hypothetical protein